MRHPVALSVLSFVALAATPAFAKNTNHFARATEGGGCVYVDASPGATCENVTAGHDVPRSGVFQAAPGGATLSLVDGATIHLSEGSRLEIGPKVPLAILGASMRASAVTLREGRARITVPPTAAPVLVHASTPLNAIATRGVTELKSGSDVLTVAAIEGKQLFAVGDVWKPVEEGKIKLVRKNGETATRDVPAAPEMGDSRTIALSGTALGAPVTVRWHAVDHAKRFEVAIAKEGGRARATTQVVDGDTFLATFPLLPPGSYEARVRALDLDGFAGSWGSPVSLDVVGAELPAGVVVREDGTVQLPQGQAIRLVGANGLDARTAGGDARVENGMVRLRASRPATLVLSRPLDETHATSIRLMPMLLRAKVTSAPTFRLASTDPVTIVVNLYGADGARVPSTTEAHPTATIGDRPVDVTWLRDGTTIRGIYTPKSAPADGTVLQVRVVDAAGEEIGHGERDLTQ